MTNNNQFTADFYARLPNRPYCSDNLGGGVIIRPKKTAIQMPYIQHNQPCFVTSLVFDVDRPDAFFAWFDANLPQPNWIARNKQNSHAHVGYMLAAPVCTTHRAKQNIIEYLAKIEQAYSLALGADRGYSGLITKNPCHSAWETHISNVQPYELGYLADFVELKELKTDLREASGLGRNCLMFDKVRFWAYEAIRQFRSSTFNQWLNEVLAYCQSVNNEFLEPLPYSEVKATAKSIAKYCWKKDGYCYQEFIARQTHKAKLGNQKSIEVRKNKAQVMAEQAQLLKAKNWTNQKIADHFNVNEKTVRRWLKININAPSDS